MWYIVRKWNCSRENLFKKSEINKQQNQGSILKNTFKIQTTTTWFKCLKGYKSLKSFLCYHLSSSYYTIQNILETNQCDISRTPYTYIITHGLEKIVIPRMDQKWIGFSNKVWVLELFHTFPHFLFCVSLNSNHILEQRVLSIYYTTLPHLIFHTE